MSSRRRVLDRALRRRALGIALRKRAEAIRKQQANPATPLPSRLGGIWEQPGDKPKVS